MFEKPSQRNWRDARVRPGDPEQVPEAILPARKGVVVEVPDRRGTVGSDVRTRDVDSLKRPRREGDSPKAEVGSPRSRSAGAGN
jgi:hypothetical protein